MSGEGEEIGKRSVGTHLLAAVQHPAWPELGFGAGLASADEGEECRRSSEGGRSWGAEVSASARECGAPDLGAGEGGCFGSQSTDLGKEGAEWIGES